MAVTNSVNMPSIGDVYGGGGTNYNMDYNGLGAGEEAYGYKPGDYSSMYNPSSAGQGIKGISSGVGTGLMMTGTPPGIIAGALITLGGNILGSLFQDKPKKSFEQLRYDRMMKYYSNLSDRFTASKAMASALTGKKLADINIGMDDYDLVQKHTPSEEDLA